MPELPEVHALAADLSARLKGRTVERFEVVAFAALKTFDPPVSGLSGRVVQTVQRHGKFLDIVIGNLHLIAHLALAGWVRWREDAPSSQSSARARKSPLAARLMFDDGSALEITEAGTRKSVALYLVREIVEVDGIAGLGPDASALSESEFAEVLASAGRARIKNVLRRQSLIAGIGNAYSDEMLHAARISPFKPADMTPEEASGLYAAMRETLQAALDRSEGLEASRLKGEKKTGLRVHGRFGQACPVCGDTIQQVVYSDSDFQYCPTCQTGGKRLSDRGMDRLLK